VTILPPDDADAQPGDDAASPWVEMFRTPTAVVVSVGDNMTELLGWSPADMIGKPSTSLIHQEDQNSAVAVWFEMVANPGVEHVWRGRYRAIDGTWRWVEAVNVYDPDVSTDAVVRTRMRRVTGAEVSVEERLREREQVLSRLSDALPVGLFQFDTERRLTFTNDRLHSIIDDTAMAASTDALFDTVTTADHDALEQALVAVLADRPVPDFEITLRTGRTVKTGLICSIALRTLIGPHGEVTGGIGCVSDVTDRVQLHRGLERARDVGVLGLAGPAPTP
jgi:PAS domain S-box-containing protein